MANLTKIHCTTTCVDGIDGDSSFSTEYLTTDEVASFTRMSRDTIYDWNYRPRKYGIPKGMFFKCGRKLLIRRREFMQWFLARG